MAQDEVGKIAQVIAQFFQRQQPLQIHRQQLESLCLLELAQQDPFRVRCRRHGPELSGELGIQCGPVRCDIQFARIQQFIQQNGVLRQVVAGPGAGGEQMYQAR